MPARDAAEPKNASLIERLKAQRAAAKPIPFDVTLPAWGAETGGVKIIARFRRIALEGKTKRSANILERGLIFGKEQEDGELAAACDLLIAGLDQLYARSPESDDVEPLDPDQPLRFDKRTAEILGLNLPEPRARAVVVEIFGGRVGRQQVIQAAKAYYGYLVAVEVDDEGKG